ncbi:unnamed protein product [Diabrotica balteata]|uniref:Mediator of RNA polymerase II transcription subunit 6 n=1 Tax=Diabrotica balteata TaxID=107213 RepID=A0A9N9XC48_DIABA|nr:unnamed protein product [Diabrotica balteata]
MWRLRADRKIRVRPPTEWADDKYDRGRVCSFTCSRTDFVCNSKAAQKKSSADYYIIAGIVYQAPDLASVLNFRLLSAVHYLQSSFEESSGFAKYHPSKGYSWDFKSQRAAEKVKKDEKPREEPNSLFQRQRVDMLLGELIRKFPLPAPPQPKIAPVPQIKQEPDNGAPENKEIKKECHQHRELLLNQVSTVKVIPTQIAHLTTILSTNVELQCKVGETLCDLKIQITSKHVPTPRNQMDVPVVRLQWVISRANLPTSFVKLVTSSELKHRDADQGHFHGRTPSELPLNSNPVPKYCGKCCQNEKQCRYPCLRRKELPKSLQELPLKEEFPPMN